MHTKCINIAWLKYSLALKKLISRKNKDLCEMQQRLTLARVKRCVHKKEDVCAREWGRVYTRMKMNVHGS